MVTKYLMLKLLVIVSLIFQWTSAAQAAETCFDKSKAKGLKGAERDAFNASYLKAVADAADACQKKAQTKGLASGGGARQTFVEACMNSQDSRAQVAAADRQDSPKKNSGNQKSEMDFFRDIGKPNEITRQPEKSKSNSNSPFKDEEITSACESEIRNMAPGYRGGIEIYKVDMLPSVKPEETGLPAMALPKTDRFYPAKIYVHYKNGDGRRFTEVFLYKTPFGLKCMRA